MRKLLAASFAAAAAIATFAIVNGLPLIAEEPRGSKDGHHAAYMECAKECGQCALACDACSAHCAMMVADGKKDHLKTLQTCQDCAAICGSAACITARTGPYSDLICTACAEACKRCGDACETQSHDAMMKKCADHCRQCEKACRDMLKHASIASR
ncbi:MAG: four-helix bundle copper-binding protein [Gemmataceae bacterium]|mgnify:CR=1 FL=1